METPNSMLKIISSLRMDPPKSGKDSRFDDLESLAVGEDEMMEGEEDMGETLEEEITEGEEGVDEGMEDDKYLADLLGEGEAEESPDNLKRKPPGRPGTRVTAKKPGFRSYLA